MVLLHGVALERLPAAAVCEGRHAASQGVENRVGRQITETETRTPFRGFIRVLNGILEPACGANDGYGPVAHRIQLIQSAWFVPGRAQEEVGSGVDEVGEPFVEADTHGETLRVPFRQARPELFVVTTAVTEEDPVRVQRHERR
jgi:hypothetical protein